MTIIMCGLFWVYYCLSCSIVVAAPTMRVEIPTDHMISILKLGEQNVTWAQQLLQINTIFIGVIALAFVSILAYITKQLIDLQKERRINEEKIKEINNLAVAISKITNEVEAVKADIRDASLANREKKTTDDDIARFIKEVWKKIPNITEVNFLKNLMWKENIGLEQIQPVIEDVELQKRIQQGYKDRFHESHMSELQVIEWAYQIKVKAFTLDELLAKHKTYEDVTKQIYKFYLGSHGQSWRDWYKK